MKAFCSFLTIQKLKIGTRNGKKLKGKKYLSFGYKLMKKINSKHNMMGYALFFAALKRRAGRNSA